MGAGKLLMFKSKGERQEKGSSGQRKIPWLLLCFLDRLKIVGEITIYYLVVMPFVHPQNTLEAMTLHHWKPHVDIIGHRGFGKSIHTFVGTCCDFLFFPSPANPSFSFLSRYSY